MRRILNVVMVVTVLGGAAGCGKRNDAPAANSKAPDPVAVKTVAAQARTVDQSISITGSLLADESVTVSSEVSGRVESIRADFGQRVRKGDVIAQLDTRELQLQHDRAKAALAQALARVGLDPNQEDVSPESTPAIRQAQAQMEDAKFKFESAAKLVKSGDISQERFTEMEKAYRARMAVLEAARDDLRTQLASIQALRADVRLAQKRLGDATVRAPFDGAVAQKHVSPGQFMRDNTPIVTLVKVWPLRLRVEIPEGATGSVKVGTSIEFNTDAAPGSEFHAVVKELNPSLDQRSRSLTAEARTSESDPRLRPGSFVQVRLVTRSGVNVVAVPKQALYSVAGLTKLFVVRNGKVVELKIAPPREFEDGWVEVSPDLLKPGDAVAVSNLGLLVAGLDVRTQG
jgi:RND family efflux transporter MFP subunit